MHGDVMGVCVDDMCQPGETCNRCGGTGREPDLTEEELIDCGAYDDA
jgi:hypothetical protein